MAVDLTLSVRALLAESTALDLGTAVMTHLFEFPGALGTGNYTTGTTDNKQDRVWSDSRSLVATSEQLDLRGVLQSALGGNLDFIEVRGILIKNKATAAASVLLVGGGANPAFAGLFAATGDIIKVPASGCLLWFAPLDGGGLATTGGTADMLTIDSGAATIAYDIVVWGVSA